MSFPKPARLRALQLAAVIFLTVSGGPYGLEPLLAQAGESAFFLLLITPILWDIPTILAILELNSMMPVTGGYYQWVKRALGHRFGFYEGWWTWLYTFADLAIYPVLFVQYASFFFPQLQSFKIPVCLSVVWISAGINFLGIVPVGKVSLFLSAAVLTPFLILLGYSFFTPGAPAMLMQRGDTPLVSLGIGLYTVMWNFIGWDNVTTYAGEVEKPVRSYIISIAIAFLVVIVIYVLALFLAVRSGIGPGVLEEQGFPALGTLIGGRTLGAIVAMGGMASALGLYSAVLLSVSRIPKVMADDGFLPKLLHRLHPKFGSPYVSITCCSVVVSGMVFWDFGELLIIDITLYGAALLLEYITLVKLRIIAPGEQRPFKIPVGVPGLILMAALPFSVYAVAMSAAFVDEGGTLKPLLFALALLVSAELAWQFAKRRTRAARGRG